MFYKAEKIDEVLTVKEFLSLPATSIQSKEPQSNITPMMGFMGINVTHHTFFSTAFSGAYWVVFGVAGFCLLSTLLEHVCRTKGREDTADNIANFTKLILPVSFYTFLYFGLVSIF